jgi:CRP-like cAMP-binding protein
MPTVPDDHDFRPSAQPPAAGIGLGEATQLPTIRAAGRPTHRGTLDEGTGWAPERMPTRVALLKTDPDLAEAVPPEHRLRARNALSVLRLGFDPGPIDLAAERFPDATFALLIIRGALTQEVDLSDRTMIELLLAGDVLLPWPPSPTAPETQVRVTALEPVQVAVLGQAYIRAAAVWPQLLIILQRRLNDQKHRLAAHGAICQLPRVEQRVMAIMWHLAARTGTVSPEGTELSRPLTHDNLAYLTGSRRPTVSLAVKRLRDLGYLDRRAEGTWLLPNVPGNAVFEDVIANLSEV